MNAVTIQVDDKLKTLRFSETLVAGSVYSVTVDGGAAVCGHSAVLALKIGTTTVAWGELTDGAGELSLLTTELAEALNGARDCSRHAALAAIRCNDQDENQVVAVGHADVLFAGDEWFATSELVKITAKGDKGDDGASAYEVAVRNGYDGTEQEWTNAILAGQLAAQEAARAAQSATSAAQNATSAAQSATSAAQTATEKANAATSAAQTATEKANAASETAQSASETAQDALQRVNAIDHHYPVVAKVLTNGAVTLDDRTINTLALGSTTAATINFPAAVQGKARDFWLCVTVSSAAAREISLVGGTCYGENAETFELNEGADFPNVIVFTEIDCGSGIFIVRRRVHPVQSNTLS